ncbi:MAG: hypothetical protein ACKOWF_02375 [Chloroflexota bacterium]
MRSLSLADSTAFAGLPVQAANQVLRIFEELQAEGGSGMGAGAGSGGGQGMGAGGNPLTMERLRRNQERQERLANLVCCAGFVRPRLVLAEAELDDDPHTMLVTDLHLDERLRYLQLALGQDGEAAKSLRPVDGAALGAVDAVPAGPAAGTPF